MGVQPAAPVFKPRHMVITAFLFVFVNIFTAGVSTEPMPNKFVVPPAELVPGEVPSVRVGSPIEGRWGHAGNAGTTPIGRHHLLSRASPRNQWAVDLPAPAGAAVNLFVAPLDPADDASVTAVITQIVDNDICTSGGGGDFITVGIYIHGLIAGRATYAHLDRHPALVVGAQVPTWGTPLGTVARLSGRATGGSNCWTGPHVHFELSAEIQPACWMSDLKPGIGVRRGDTLGFVTGPLGYVASTCIAPTIVQ